jgi:hypothetical protein
MEILVEILVEVLVRLVGAVLGGLLEVLLQVAVQLLASVFGHAVSAVAQASASVVGHAVLAPWRARDEVSPLVAVVGYQLYGAVVGGLSLLLFPAHLVADPGTRWLNLAITPVLSGLVMVAVGAWRRRHEQTLIRLDSFAYGWCFAMAVALVRWKFAT